MALSDWIFGTIHQPIIRRLDVNTINGKQNNPAMGIGSSGPLIPAPVNPLYWVGNSGNWSDSSHWSTTSGGVGGSFPPDNTADAIFDVNSFTLPNQIVTIDTNGVCRTLNCYEVINSPSFDANFGSVIFVYKDLYLSPSLQTITTPYSSQIVFNMASDSIQNILTTGTIQDQNIIIQMFKQGGFGPVASTGTFNLLNDIVSIYKIAVFNATLNTNNHTLNFYGYHYDNNTGPNFNVWQGTVNLGTSIINLFDQSSIGNSIGAIGISAPIGPFNGLNATINLYDNTTVAYGIWGTINIYGKNTTITSTEEDFFDSQPDVTIQTINFYPSGELHFPGKTTRGSSTTASFTVNSLQDLSTSNNHASLTASALGGAQANVTIGLASVNYLDVGDINAVGASTPITDSNGVDGGNNTGWIFSNLPSNNLRFWVGNSGSWDDTAHWSAQSGGLGGASVPTRFNDVYFDDQSFSLAGQTVTINLGATKSFYVNTIDWSDTILNPTWFINGNLNHATLVVFGSFILTQSMSVQAPRGGIDAGFIIASNTPGCVIDTKNVPLVSSHDSSGFNWFSLTTLNTQPIDVISDLTVGFFGIGFFGPTSTNCAVNLNGHTFTLGNFRQHSNTFNVPNIPSICNPGAAIFNMINPEDTGFTIFDNISVFDGSGIIINYNYDVNFNNEYLFDLITTGQHIGTVNFNGKSSIDPFNPYSFFEWSAGTTIQTVNMPPGTALQIMELNTYNIVNFNAQGTASKPIVLRTITQGVFSSERQYTIQSANPKLSYIDVSKCIGAGNIPFYDPNGVDSGQNVNWVFASAPSGGGGTAGGSSNIKTRYWVGDAGSWDDTAHWSTQSGGAGGASVPTRFNDVFFDANSFTLNGQTVTLTAAGIYYMNIFTAFGTASRSVIFRSSAPGTQYTMNAVASSLGYIDVEDSFAAGNIPFYDPNGTDSSNNINWVFGPKPSPINALPNSNRVPALYTVEIRDQYGRPFITLVRPQQKQFSIYRNKPGSCQFILDLYDPQALPQYLQNSIYSIVFRRNGVPVIAGQLTYHEPKINDSDKEKVVNVTATGFFDLLDYRIITEDYPGYDALHNKLPFSETDVGQIAWTLVNYAQFPIPNADDDTQTVVLVDGSNSVQQSFVAQGTSPLRMLKFVIQNQNISPGTNLIIELINDANNTPRGTVIPNSTASIPVSQLPGALTWFEVDYPKYLNVLLQNQQKYWISLRLDTPQSGGNGLMVQVLGTSLVKYYPYGNAYSLEGPGLFIPNQDIQFFALLYDNSYQMTKNTYFGIELGTIQPSFTLTPTFDRYKHIKSAIEDMSTTFNGMDFAITAVIDPETNILSKYFNVYYPGVGIDNTNLRFNYPGNIKKMGKPKDGTTLINEAYMRGQGSGNAQTLATVRDTFSIYTYTLRQKDISEPDVSDPDTLTSFGNEYIRINKDPSDLPGVYLDGNMPPTYGTYGIGDLIKIKVNDPRAPILNFINNYKIEEIDVTIDDDGVEEIQLNCSPV